MGLIYLSSIYLSFFLTITFIPKSKSSDLITNYHCSPETVTFPPNNTYDSTLNTLIHYLSSNASVSPTGFYNTSIYDRTIDNTFYGYFLCRGDFDSHECHTCVSTAVAYKKSCPASVRETIFYQNCTIRYSNEPLDGVLAMNPYFSQKYSQNVFIPGNRNDLVGLFLELVPKAANNNQSGRKYATTVIRYSEVNLYVMAQCKPDLSVNDCQICLSKAAKSLQIKYGGNYMTPSCNIRYETYPFFKGAESLLPPSGKKKVSATKVVVPVLVALAAIIGVVIALRIYLLRKKANKAEYLRKKANKAEYPLIDINDVLENLPTVESLTFNLGTLEVATNNFSDDQKLGEGGFGIVYKGTLSDGQEIAVKRLSKDSKVSGQGVEEFKKEVELIAKLQHRNLVKTLGFCLDGEEKLLVYEFLPNKSLDYFIFDPAKQGELNWPTRYNIIRGIARGLLYLHEDSRQKIIHRDLKAGNILLDATMDPKISDFGLARMFKVEQTEAETNKIAGTYGYMSPEYAMQGQISVKSDVYSFGVLVLEIISGKKICATFHQSEAGDLLTYAWRSLTEENPLRFMDPTLTDSYSSGEVLRCIHLGCLCVQESTDMRPTMSTIVSFMLSGGHDSTISTMQMPERPRSFYISSTESSIVARFNQQSTSNSMASSNDISDLNPR